MVQTQILAEIGKLSIPDRLTLLEDALREIRTDLQQTEPTTRRARRAEQLVAAAQALLADYSADGELTAFTALDGEEFYATR